MRLTAVSMAESASTPLSDSEFAALMAAAGPFEDRPRLAVAVSGGSDSLALCRLADRWARGCDGEVVALTVDHRLREASSDEADSVGAWMSVLGITHRILVWTPDGTTQQAARDGRYHLLQEACRNAGILHLMVGHTANDQAETSAFRHVRGSGPDGLAGMAMVREINRVRIIRPLLTVGRDRLQAMLTDLDQPWIDDPTNKDDRFARPRLRKRLAARPKATTMWTRRSVRAGTVRRQRDIDLADALARWAAIHQAGYATADTAILDLPMAPDMVGRMVRTVRGSDYAPSSDRLNEICRNFRRGAKSRTIGGCRIVLGRHLTVVREVARIPDRFAVKAGDTVRWDDRFVVTAAQDGDIACLGEAAGAFGASTLPSAVVRSLPALWRSEKIISLPAIQERQMTHRSGMKGPLRVRFRPPHPLAGAAHCCMFGVV